MSHRTTQSCCLWLQAVVLGLKCNASAHSSDVISLQCGFNVTYLITQRLQAFGAVTQRVCLWVQKKVRIFQIVFMTCLKLADTQAHPTANRRHTYSTPPFWVRSPAFSWDTRWSQANGSQESDQRHSILIRSWWFYDWSHVLIQLSVRSPLRQLLLEYWATEIQLKWIGVKCWRKLAES